MDGNESSAAPAVQLTGIVKRFPGVIANRDVNLRVERGQVHAIVGENLSSTVGSEAWNSRDLKSRPH